MDHVITGGQLTWALEVQTEVTDVDIHHYDLANIEAFVLTYRMLSQNNDRYSISRLAENYKFAHRLFRDAFEHIRSQRFSFLSAAPHFRLGMLPLLIARYWIP